MTPPDLLREAGIARERERFEAWISASPYEHSVARFGFDEDTTAWPGQYRLSAVQLAWDAWKQATATGERGTTT